MFQFDLNPQKNEGEKHKTTRTLIERNINILHTQTELCFNKYIKNITPTYSDEKNNTRMLLVLDISLHKSKHFQKMLNS